MDLGVGARTKHRCQGLESSLDEPPSLGVGYSSSSARHLSTTSVDSRPGAKDLGTSIRVPCSAFVNFGALSTSTGALGLSAENPH